MDSLLVQIFLLLPLISIGIPYVSVYDMYNPEYAYDENNEVSEEEDVEKAPEFVSKSVNLVVNEGETISLPCIVTRLQGFVLLWRHNGSIISVGDQVIGSNSRYSLESQKDGNNLMISLAEQADEGEYVCQVSAFKPTQIHHSVSIRVRPSLQTSPVKSLTVLEGEEARLYCRVVGGGGDEKLLWRRKGGLLPTGEEFIVGCVIIFSSVTPEHGGTYQCMTEEEYGGEEVTREVELYVEYAPVIEIEQTHIKTEYLITCTVHGYPPPTVVWLKDGHPVEEDSEGLVMTRSGSSHTLIRQDREEGEYGCQAANKRGVVTKYAGIQGSHQSSTDSSSSEKPHSYPKLDIRNYYLESVDDSEITPITMDYESDKSEEIKNIKGLRIFSYRNHLGKIINPHRIETKYSDTVDTIRDGDMKRKIDNQEDDKVAADFSVTDMTDGKALPNSYSFVIDNLHKEKKNHDKSIKRTKDDGLGWDFKEFKTKKELHQSNLENEHKASIHEVGKDESKSKHQKSEENTTPIQMAISYRGSFSKGSDLEDNAVVDEIDPISDDKKNNEAKKINNLNPRYLEFSNVQSKEQNQPNMQGRNGVGKNEPQNKNFGSKTTYSKNVDYFGINEEVDSKDADIYAENEDIYVRQESNENLKNMGKHTTDEEPENTMVSVDTLDDKVKENKKESDTPVSGNMFLTTSIVTEEIGETNLENISPYEKPYIIPPLSKELIIVKRINYTNEGKDIYTSEYDSPQSILREMNEEGNNINTLGYADGLLKISGEGEDNSHIPKMRATEDNTGTITKQYLDETKDEAIHIREKISHVKTNTEKGNIIMGSTNATDFEYNKEEEQLVEDKNQVLRENDYLQKVMGKSNKNEESISPAEMKDDSDRTEESIEKEDHNIGVQLKYQQHIGSGLENTGESTITKVDFASLDEHEHSKINKLKSASEQSFDNSEYDNEDMGVQTMHEIYIKPKHTQDGQVKKMESEHIHQDYEIKSEHEIIKMDKYEVPETDNKSNATPTLYDENDFESNIKHIHDKKIDSEKNESISEEGINRIDKLKILDRDYESNAIRSEYENDMDDDVESHTEFDHEKKMELEQIHQDYENLPEVYINKYESSDRDYESNSAPREYDQDYNDEDVDPLLGYEHEKKIKSEQNHQDHATRSEEEVNEIDNYEVLDKDNDSYTSPIVYDKDDISQSSHESDDETDKNDYIDYSYAEIATHKKPSGPKYEDNRLPKINKRKDKPRQEVPWIKKFKFRMVGNKVVMVLKKAV